VWYDQVIAMNACVVADCNFVMQWMAAEAVDVAQANSLLLSLFYSHQNEQPVLAGIPSLEPEDFVGAKFYRSHALAYGN